MQTCVTELETFRKEKTSNNNSGININLMQNQSVISLLAVT
jgi:hypothetical protein